MKSKISSCLWFDTQAEEAARFYVSIFKDSRILSISHYGEAGKEIHGKPPGSVMTVSFELNGQSFTALNGGPIFKFNEAISLQIECENQAEVDHYWNRLSEGGDPNAQQCGWLKDKFGLSWQVVPKILAELLNDPDTVKSQRAFESMLRMKKLEIADLQCSRLADLHLAFSVVFQFNIDREWPKEMAREWTLKHERTKKHERKWKWKWQSA